jgi:probable F420-dependent oxidoreductase
MHQVKFGLFLLPADIAEAQAAAVQAEREGFYSVSVNDHFYSPLGSPRAPQLECFTALTAMACVTRTIRLAPAVAAASFRTPALLAKITSSLDLASQGRLTVGLGAGWQGPEYETHGYRFPPLKERLEQLEECIGVLKAMWTEEAPSFQGRHFSVRDAYNHPRPLQRPHPPLMLGGSGTGLLRIAARHANVLNIIPPTRNSKDFPNDPETTRRFDDAELKRRIALLHGFLREEGRAPDEVELGGLLVLELSEDARDPALREAAARLGFQDYAAAQRAPVALFGTPAEVRSEIARRVEQAGLTWFILIASTPRSQALFAREVLPAFAS